jgi:pyruvate/2-oxoglutarate dehydrogenase complex dihydrolipoamide acyltransferase (E2) component
MAFWYQLPVPALDDPQPKSVRLIEWLVQEGVAVHRGTRIAIIETPSGRYAVLTNDNGFLRKRHFPPGAEVDLTTPIAVIAADGEDIPYGKPYSLAERLTEFGATE